MQTVQTSGPTSKNDRDEDSEMRIIGEVKMVIRKTCQERFVAGS